MTAVLAERESRNTPPLERLYPLLLQGDTPVVSVMLLRGGSVRVYLSLSYPTGTTVSATLSWGPDESIRMSDEGQSCRAGMDHWLRRFREENLRFAASQLTTESIVEVSICTEPLYRCSPESMRMQLLEFGHRCIHAATDIEVGLLRGRQSDDTQTMYLF